jgi:hypothetical protein
MNPNNELDRQRLIKAIENSTRVLRPFRDVRKRLVKDFAGSYYGQTESMGKSDIIMNLMYQTAETYTMSLAANRPRLMVHHTQQALDNKALVIVSFCFRTYGISQEPF